MARTGIFLSDDIGDRIRAVAEKLHMSANAVGASFIEDCVSACTADTPHLPSLVSHYRRLERKDIDWVDRMVLPMLRSIFPRWEEEDSVWREMFGRLVEQHIEAGGSVTPEALRTLGKQARTAAKAMVPAVDKQAKKP